MGWDGTLLEVPASAANVAALGRQRGAHYPQARLVALVACGTRAVLGAALGAAAERELAGELLGVLGKGMLLLADRGFFSFDLWRRAAGTGADLLWRVKGDLHLPLIRVLPDGSYLSVLPSPDQARRAANHRYYRKISTRPRRGARPRPVTGTPVRVIAFTLAITGSDGRIRAESYRLLTTLLDPAAAPAADGRGQGLNQSSFPQDRRAAEVPSRAVRRCQASLPRWRRPRMRRSSSLRNSGSSSGPHGRAHPEEAPGCCAGAGSTSAVSARPAGCLRKAASAAGPVGRARWRGRRVRRTNEPTVSRAKKAPSSSMAEA